jgi:hypothetical protein
VLPSLIQPRIIVRTLEEEEKKKRVITLPPYYYHFVQDRDNSAMKGFSPYSGPRQPTPLPYWPSGFPDLNDEYRNE